MKQNKQKSAVITFQPSYVLGGLLLSIAALIALHISLQYLVFHGGAGKLTFLVDLFNLDGESSIPTWFSQSLLIVSAVISASIAFVKSRRNEPFARQWRIVSAVFLFLSIDEIATIHEHLINIVQTSSLTAGSNAWYVFAVLIIAPPAMMLARFWWRLPMATRTLLALAASMYLFGAVFFDSFSGKYAGSGFLLHGLLIAFEEGLEMLGACLFAYSLARYAHQERLLLAFRFGPTPIAAPVASLASQPAKPVAQKRPTHRPRYVMG